MVQMVPYLSDFLPYSLYYIHIISPAFCPDSNNVIVGEYTDILKVVINFKQQKNSRKLFCNELQERNAKLYSIHEFEVFTDPMYPGGPMFSLSRY